MRTDDETAPSERVASMNERVVWERERVENMMETERKLRRKQKRGRRSEQARKRRKNEKGKREKATEMAKEGKCSVTREVGVGDENVRENGRRGEKIIQETGAASAKTRR